MVVLNQEGKTERVDFIVQYLCLVCWISLLLLLSLRVCLTAHGIKNNARRGMGKKKGVLLWQSQAILMIL